MIALANDLFGKAAGNHVPNPPEKAKERLEKDGVDFRVPDGEEEILEEGRLTYYVVNLIYEVRPKKEYESDDEES